MLPGYVASVIIGTVLPLASDNYHRNTEHCIRCVITMVTDSKHTVFLRVDQKQGFSFSLDIIQYPVCN